MQQNQSSTIKKVFTIVSFVIFIGLMVFLAFVVGKPLVQMAQDPEKLEEYLNSFGFGSRLVLIGIQFLQVFIAFIPGEVVEIGSGYIFGGFEGTILCLVGCAVASAIVYLITKYFGIKLVEVFVSKEQISQLKFINNSEKLNLLVFILYFIPGTPKDVITYLIGLTPMKLSTFLLISTVARIPSVVTSTYGGGAIRNGDYSLAIWIFAITGIVSIIGIFVYRQLLKKKQNNTK